MAARADPLTLLQAALRGGSLEWVDLTHPLSEATPIIELPEPYANTPGWSLEEVSRYDERGPLFYWNSFGGSEHMGTHFDARSLSSRMRQLGREFSVQPPRCRAC